MGRSAWCHARADSTWLHPLPPCAMMSSNSLSRLSSLASARPFARVRSDNRELLALVSLLLPSDPLRRVRESPKTASLRARVAEGCNLA